ncbi:MAG: hypothetical protein AMXMBFR84_29960 [Candidatus Hydrogenedentota bacterium]
MGTLRDQWGAPIVHNPVQPVGPEARVWLWHSGGLPVADTIRGQRIMQKEPRECLGEGCACRNDGLHVV